MMNRSQSEVFAVRLSVLRSRVLRTWFAVVVPRARVFLASDLGAARPRGWTSRLGHKLWVLLQMLLKAFMSVLL